MSDRNIIFANRMKASNWALIGAALLVAGAIIALDYGIAYAAALIAGLAIFTFGGMVLVVAVVARRQVAELASDGQHLFVETFRLLGRGRELVIPIEQVEGWRWTAQSGGKARFATLAFAWRGQTYSMPFNGAQLVDRTALAELAPVAFADPAVRR